MTRSAFKLAAVSASALALAACTPVSNRQTLAHLHDVPADTADVEVGESLERAMQSYRRFLEETPGSAMTPEAMRRLADLQIEQRFGIAGDESFVDLPAPEIGAVAFAGETASPELQGLASDSSESDAAFEERTTSAFEFESTTAEAVELPGELADLSGEGPIEAIRIYQQILERYPSYERADQVLYQMARAYDETAQPDEAMSVMERLVAEYAWSDYLDEVHFRRGEYLFTRRQYRAAEAAYEPIIAMGAASSYYELALYKLGWALYKQEFYDLALHQFMALLDYKLSIGYDFDAQNEEGDERRVADTYRVISLSFSNLGGPEVVNEYFADNGRRSYEDRIYSNLGEFYLDKLRYNDAATVYDSFVELNPFHRVAPQFSMRIVQIYEAGGFPLLVVESRKSFATNYGLRSEYWQYFDAAEQPEVIGYLKANLTDLANHYHALYQEDALVDERPANFAEASNWYREFLASFPAETESPGVNHQLADLLLENEDFGEAAVEYERTAYDYGLHERASEAGYAAIFAHREHLSIVDESSEITVRRATVASSLRFSEAFPEHEFAPVVLGAAADDLFAMNQFDTAIVAARRLIERYPDAEEALRQSAWTVVAHASFELALFADAEVAYASVLGLLAEDDESRDSFIDNMAAAIYQQGEQANADGDYRMAAEHFLRVRDAAPTSTIRASAQYDGAAALIQLEDWVQAGSVLEEFRDVFPEHELQSEVTKQLAAVYRSAGALGQSAAEYERVAAESQDPELQREAMLLAGELYQEANDTSSAIAVWLGYLEQFPRPLDMAQETRNRLADMFETRGDVDARLAMLEEIVAADSDAGTERTDRSRFLAAHASLVLAQPYFDSFKSIELVLPFEESLASKQNSMDAAIVEFERLVTYQVSEVNAAATWYIAEIYYEFSQALLRSEVPADLPAAALVDYELALEEEAFPFEERAIEVHEQNFASISSGVYNTWLAASLEKLAALVPGRYAKNEVSAGFLGSLEQYAYRSPAAVASGVADASAESGGDDAPLAQAGQ